MRACVSTCVRVCACVCVCVRACVRACMCADEGDGGRAGDTVRGGGEHHAAPHQSVQPAGTPQAPGVRVPLAFQDGCSSASGVSFVSRDGLQQTPGVGGPLALQDEWISSVNSDTYKKNLGVENL